MPSSIYCTINIIPSRIYWALCCYNVKTFVKSDERTIYYGKFPKIYCWRTNSGNAKESEVIPMADNVLSNAQVEKVVAPSPPTTKSFYRFNSDKVVQATIEEITRVAQSVMKEGGSGGRGGGRGFPSLKHLLCRR
jgi:hypothetical protein